MLADELALDSPYQFTEHAFKVQLHAHTTRSDGKCEPQSVMQAYEQLGYAAVALTDHDYLGRTTPSLEDPGGHGIVHIPGVEYSADEQNKSWRHILGLLIQSIHHADGLAARQEKIRQARAEGGLAFLCHPYTEQVHRRGWTTAHIAQMHSYHGIEIYNGASCGQPDKLAYFPPAVDRVLAAGKRIHLLVTDDFHKHIDRGFIVINSAVGRDKLTLAEVVAALKSGNFFGVGRSDPDSPPGPRFTDIRIEKHKVIVETDQPAEITFMTSRHNATTSPLPYAHRESNASRAAYTACRDDRFIRVQATIGEDAWTSYAWSNPIYVRPA